MTTVQVGTLLPTVTVDVDAQRMKTMAALLGDPNPIHYDPDAVAALGLGDRTVNQGPTNLGYVVNVLLSFVDGDPARIRRVTARFLGNVLAGDRIHASGEVASVEVVDGRTIATCEIWLDRDDGTRLLTGTAQVTCP